MIAFTPFGFLTILCINSLAIFFDMDVESAKKISLGKTMPNIQVVKLSGSTAEIASMFNNQPALIVFWATWCQPCRKEVPDINQLLTNYGSKGLVILGVSLGEPLNVVKAHVTQLNIAYPVVVAPSISNLATLGIDRVPLLILIDKDRRIVQMESSVNESLRRRINQFVAE